MGATKRAGIYVRVSRKQQEPENQIRELRRIAELRGYEMEFFIDRGFSGSLKRSGRPALDQLMEAARRRKIDVVMAWDLSRIARSVAQLVEYAQNFNAWNVQLVTVRDNIDTTTANGRLIFHIFAALAEFERELIRERIYLGLDRARAQGKKFGRKMLVFDPSKIAIALEKKMSVRAAARFLNTSPASAQRRLIKAMEATHVIV